MPPLASGRHEQRWSKRGEKLGLHKFYSLQNERRVTPDQMPRRIFANCRTPGRPEPAVLCQVLWRRQVCATPRPYCLKAPHLQSVIHVVEGSHPKRSPSGHPTLREGDLR